MTPLALLRRYFTRAERRSAANHTAIVSDGIAAMLDTMAEHHELIGQPGVAAVYEDAADRARCMGIEIAEAVHQ